jgi:hypothetical protein
MIWAAVELFIVAGEFFLPFLLDFHLRIHHYYPTTIHFSVRQAKEGPTMMIHTEAKPQGWRAVAVFDDGRHEALLYLGRSSTQVRTGFGEAFFEILDDEERAHVQSVALQRWHGAPDAGRWMHQTNLKVPSVTKVALRIA